MEDLQSLIFSLVQNQIFLWESLFYVNKSVNEIDSQFRTIIHLKQIIEEYIEEIECKSLQNKLVHLIKWFYYEKILQQLAPQSVKKIKKNNLKIKDNDMNLILISRFEINGYQDIIWGSQELAQLLNYEQKTMQFISINLLIPKQIAQKHNTMIKEYLQGQQTQLSQLHQNKWILTSENFLLKCIINIKLFIHKTQITAASLYQMQPQSLYFHIDKFGNIQGFTQCCYKLLFQQFQQSEIIRKNIALFIPSLIFKIYMLEESNSNEQTFFKTLFVCDNVIIQKLHQYKEKETLLLTIQQLCQIFKDRGSEQQILLLKLSIKKYEFKHRIFFWEVNIESFQKVTLTIGQLNSLYNIVDKFYEIKTTQEINNSKQLEREQMQKWVKQLTFNFDNIHIQDKEQQIRQRIQCQIDNQEYQKHKIIVLDNSRENFGMKKDKLIQLSKRFNTLNQQFIYTYLVFIILVNYHFWIKIMFYYKKNELLSTTEYNQIFQFQNFFSQYLIFTSLAQFYKMFIKSKHKNFLNNPYLFIEDPNDHIYDQVLENWKSLISISDEFYLNQQTASNGIYIDFLKKTFNFQTGLSTTAQLTFFQYIKKMITISILDKGFLSNFNQYQPIKTNINQIVEHVNQTFDVFMKNAQQSVQDFHDFIGITQLIMYSIVLCLFLLYQLIIIYDVNLMTKIYNIFLTLPSTVIQSNIFYYKKLIIQMKNNQHLKLNKLIQNINPIKIPNIKTKIIIYKQNFTKIKLIKHFLLLGCLGFLLFLPSIIFYSRLGNKFQNLIQIKNYYMQLSFFNVQVQCEYTIYSLLKQQIINNQITLPLTQNQQQQLLLLQNGRKRIQDMSLLFQADYLFIDSQQSFSNYEYEFNCPNLPNFMVCIDCQSSFKLKLIYQQNLTQIIQIYNRLEYDILKQFRYKDRQTLINDLSEYLCLIRNLSKHTELHSEYLKYLQQNLNTHYDDNFRFIDQYFFLDIFIIIMLFIFLKTVAQFKKNWYLSERY